MRSLTKPKWLDYWSELDDPLNNDSTAAYYREYGAELSLLLGSTAEGRVLEVGCGDGSLAGPLGFDRSRRYLGLDPSLPMLKAFEARHPALDIEQGDHSFRNDETFDLIFSCAVVQFMSPEMVRTHMDNCAAMLAPGGRIVWASVPWTRMRWSYARRDLTGFPRRSLPKATLAHAKRRLVSDNMGFWHDTPFFSQLAEEHGLSYRFFGSLNYSYRFHSVFERPVS
jgi:cyclopropane fatty-acyl-phospholipid synthase-like methyltransferase